jgi:DNA-binding NarL/FixJ family response regulator
VNPVELTPFSPLHNCFRCGKEFRAGGGDRICSACRAPKPIRQNLNPNLSFREKQVVKLVTQAKLNKEIAYELHLTEGTVKEYLNRIFKKLEVSNRTALAVWAMSRPPTQEMEESVA